MWHYLHCQQWKTKHSLVSSRLNYRNALLSGLPRKSTMNLKWVQQLAARILAHNTMRNPISLLSNPVLSRHILKKYFLYSLKSYLNVIVVLTLSLGYDGKVLYIPARSLRWWWQQHAGYSGSQEGNLLIVPIALKLWDSLPENLGDSNTVSSFSLWFCV